MVWKHKSPAIIRASAEALDKYGNPRIGGGCPSSHRMMMAAAGVSGGNQTLLQVLTDLSLTGNLKLCLDAGDSDSYTSGQSWLDRSGGGYDFFRGADNGASSDDPTFNGAAGGLSINEYWSVDGGDFFNYDTTEEAWMNNIHKNNADFSILAWIWQNASADFTPICGDRASNTPSFSFYQGIGSGLLIGVDNTGGGGFGCLNVSADSEGQFAEWSLVGLTLDEAAGAGGSFFYRGDSNGNGYDQVSSVDTFDGTYTSPSASNSADNFNILAQGGNLSVASNNTRLAMLAIWEGGHITKANFDSIWDNTKGRMGL